MVTPAKVLAVRFGRLGDVILLLRSLAALKLRWPHVRLALLTDYRFAPLATLCPYVDQVIPVDRIGMRDGSKYSAALGMAGLVRTLRKERFDVAVDFHGFLETQLLVGFSRSKVRVGLHRQAKRWIGRCFNRPAVIEDKSLHVADMFLRIAAAAAESDLPDHIPAVLRAPEKLAAAQPGGRIAGFYTGAGAADRMWPPQKFARLADMLAEQNVDVLLFGGTSNWEIDVRRRIEGQCRYRERVHTPAVLSTAELVAAISQCDVFISNDTGPMHIGPAVNVPTVGLFSVGFPEHYRPYGSGHGFLQAAEIDAITPEAVIAEVRRLWPDFSGPRT